MAIVKQIIDRMAGTKLDAESVRLLQEITGTANLVAVSTRRAAA